MTQWTPGTVEVDFGAGPVVVPRGLRYLTRNDPVPMPADGPIDWTQLDKLPALITIEWSGPDRGVVAAAAARQVQFLYWFDADGDVDLSGTSVAQVRLGGSGLRSVRLPASVQRLQLNDAPLADVRVEAPDNGRGLELQLFSQTANGDRIAVPVGLERVADLWLSIDSELTLSVLSGLTNVRTLRVTFNGAPGTLTGLPVLRQLPTLRTLRLESAYDWDPDDLPDLPGLRELVLHGVRRTTATTLRQRFADGPVTVTARQAKADSWLAAHLLNPFRDWVHDSRAFGAAACKAYTRARTAVDSAPADDPDRSAALESALRGLVADLNTIDARHGLIDTLNREHACDVYLDLARHAGVALDVAEVWLDTDRRW